MSNLLPGDIFVYMGVSNNPKMRIYLGLEVVDGKEIHKWLNINANFKAFGNYNKFDHYYWCAMYEKSVLWKKISVNRIWLTP